MRLGQHRQPLQQRVQAERPEPALGLEPHQLAVQERCRLAGIEGDFSAHSLRSGFVTEAGRQNVPLGDAMAMTGHASVATVMGYFRAGAAPRSRAARLLDTPTGDETA